ncbi:DUF3800 domain-containing protein [Antribacter gilvus]|uniref:DUF3800 domain-containing protein n=1 Tax=Antribacter gilvus TaxID=2304675 RepID=UPI00197E45D2|nr:DUF3800 domain-containing protein [Antribacter gilvus]
MVHLAYVDDSGDSRHGTTLSALIVEDQHWSGLLEAWLQGRRAIHKEFGVPKNRELHSTELYKGRGALCETAAQNARFTQRSRAAAGRIMLAELGRFEHFDIATIATSEVRKPLVYAKFIAWLEDWAAARNTHLMVFYDGQQGLAAPDSEPTPEELTELWTTAVRNAGPYRKVHRELELSSRRIVEDVIMQDSQFSQLIQAADLIAYGAYQKHRQSHPEIWRGPGSPSVDAIRAYMRLRPRWSPDSDHGVHWLG